MPLSNDKAIERKKRVVNIFHNPLTAWIILGVVLVLTFTAYRIFFDSVKKRALDQFEFRSIEVEHAISERLRVYEQLLWSGVGLMYASDHVSRTEFARFVNAMNMEKHWPGIQGIGFSVPVKPEDRQDFINRIREEGFPDFTIKPEGEREMYSSIIYLEPFDWRNQRAFGYDMWSNDIRREAMLQARDEGKAVTSGIITLVQETDKDVQKGFLTYVPAYKTHDIPETLEQRRSQFVGWVYAPYRVENLMQGILGTEDPDIEFEIFDGRNMNKESLLFDSNSDFHMENINYQPDFTKTIEVTNQGRLWTIYFNTPMGFLKNQEQKQPRFIAITGIIVDILLFYVLWSMYFINKRAESMAKVMTNELEQTNLRLEDEIKKRTGELQKAHDSLEEQVIVRTKELNEKVGQLQRMNNTMIDRERRMVELKKEIQQLKKMD